MTTSNEMWNRPRAILTVFSMLLPLWRLFSVLGTVGLVVTGIWLAVLGEWRTLGLGVGAFIVVAVIHALAMKIGSLFEGPMTRSDQRGDRRGYWLLTICCTTYFLSVLAAWNLAFLFFFLRIANRDALLPTMLLSYCLASGYIVFVAEQRLRTPSFLPAEVFGTFFASIAYGVALLMLAFGEFRSQTLIIAMLAMMLAAAVFTLLLGAAITDQTQRPAMPKSS